MKKSGRFVKQTTKTSGRFVNNKNGFTCANPRPDKYIKRETMRKGGFAPSPVRNLNETRCIQDPIYSESTYILGPVFVFTGISSILGLQPRDKAAMLVVKTKETFLLNLHQNRVHFPAERNAFVLDHQHGRRDVTCKPAIRSAILQHNKQHVFISRSQRKAL